MLDLQSDVAKDVLGDSLVVLACFMSCVGVNLQKWAHNHNEKLAADKRSSMYLSGRWWAGIGMMILASLMDLAALPLIPLSRVAALGSTTLVANVMLTPWFQRERLTRHDIVGCIMTVVGSASASYFGATRQADFNQEVLLSLITAPLFIHYTIAVVILVMIYLYLIDGFNQMEDELKRRGVLGGVDQPEVLECVWAFDNLDEVVAAMADGDAPLTDSPTTHIKPKQRFVLKFGPQFYPTVHASLGGLLGGHSIMFAKSTIVLANEFYDSLSIITLALTLVGLGFTLLTILGQVHYLNKGLRIYKDVLFVLPVYQACWVVSGVASGLIYYQEYLRIPQSDLWFFVLGVAITLSGLLVLGMRKSLVGGKVLHP